ncbi:hypothetical protein GCM10025867_48200 (plasmid) [Frondihabitans sucicola]|uniref:Calcineurin-like phosphoesterase domain-containing protein n=1 Tax=Frondihabitans sucicola TaxID=1268041 RepID=A0ABM8GPY1_9MICO|nr:metallophosphoesterase [Frondihabitans sucicola]BDZ50516.1 hypothetical protein GCM10025867_27570 [Frondihabitans sucicola]BDZ52579.1 hypothetical protein GCM10025867_48200 [Frondihabitans sucicola]
MTAWVPDAADPRVVVAGDWHSNIIWAMKVIPRAAQMAPGAKTILQLGDFNIGRGRVAKAFVNMVDARCRGNGIEQVLITPGNHEDYGRLRSTPAWVRREPVRIGQHIWVLPHGYRFVIGGRTFMSFGGAASVDRHRRNAHGKNRDWWPDEVARKEAYAEAALSGPADIMLTHEAVNGATEATAGIEEGRNPGRWPADRLWASAISRSRTTDLWNAIHPGILFHGHIHSRAEATLEDGRRVYSMAPDERPGNIGVLELETLHWRWG